MRMWEREFIQLEETFDGRFHAGRNGIRSVCTPRDRVSEWLVMEDDSAYARLRVPFSQPILYPVREPQLSPGPKAVLMDLDGTSVISEEFWIWTIELTMKEVLGNTGFLLAREDMPYVSGFSVSEHLQYCMDKYGGGGDINEARQVYHRTAARELQKISQGTGRMEAFRVRPGLREFLRTLKEENIKVGLVTSGLYEKAMPEILSAFRQMEMGDPLDFYDAVVTAGTAYGKGSSGTLGEYSAKPHPWLYAEIAGVGLGLGEEDRDGIVVLEDSSAGVLAGRLAGFPVIGLEGGNIRQAGVESLTHFMADNLQEIVPVLLGDSLGRSVNPGSRKRRGRGTEEKVTDKA